MVINYDPALHRYTDHTGRRILSNTKVLELAGLTPRYDFVDEPRRRAALTIGKDVEQATLLMDTVVQPVKEMIRYSHVLGYVEAWLLFKKEFDFKPLLREQLIYDETLDCCTRLDAFGESNQGWITVQIKTGKVDDWVAIQTAFEERCAWIHNGQNDSRTLAIMISTPNRWGIELRADGKYVPRHFNQPGFENDIKVFISALNVAKWKVAHGH